MLFQTKLIQSITKELKKELSIEIQNNGRYSTIKPKADAPNFTSANFKIINDEYSEFIAYIDDTKRRTLVEEFEGRNEVTAITQNCEVRIPLNNSERCVRDIVKTLTLAEIERK